MFDNQILADVFNQLHICYSSGISIIDSVDIVKSEADNNDVETVFGMVSEHLHKGNNFYESLVYADAFDDYLLTVVRVGESTGYLDQVFEELNLYYGRLDWMQKKIREAVTYPFILIVSMILVLYVLVSQILPVFKQVLNSMGTDLNSLAYLLMGIGEFLSSFALIIIMILVILLLTYYLFIRRKYGEKWFSRVFHHNFLTRKISEDYSVSKYLFGLNLLLKSGYYDEESLSLLNSLVDNDTVSEQVEVLLAEFKKERNIAHAVSKAGLLDKRSEKILNISQISGTSEKVVDSICETYESKVDETINRFMNTIEPVLIIICVVLVGIILLSVMLPLISIMAGM